MWVNPYLVLVDLDRLDFLGCAEVCGERTIRGTLSAPASLTTLSLQPDIPLPQSRTAPSSPPDNTSGLRSRSARQ